MVIPFSDEINDGHIAKVDDSQCDHDLSRHGHYAEQ